MILMFHRVCRTNWDVDGLNQNPNSNKEDIIGVHWHGDVELGAIPWWHASTYPCTLLECFGDVSWTNISGGTTRIPNFFD
jgi:hypothetical protein